MYFTQIDNGITNNKLTLDAVIERYVGRRPELIKIEAELEKLRKKIVDSTFSVIKGKMDGKDDFLMDDMNASEENKKIEKLFKQLFQLKHVEIFWIKTSIPNASTPCKALQFLDKSYSIDKDGVDINPKMSVYVNVHTSLFTHLNMTAGEVLAIILHEFGHNFYQSAFQVLKRLNPFDPLNSAISVLITDVFEWHIPLNKLFSLPYILANKFKVTKLVTAFEEAMIIQKIFSLPVLNMIKILLSGTKTLNLKKIFSDPSTIFFNYAVEKHADSFAIDYGYGTELASGLNKMAQREKNVAYDIPLFNWVKDFNQLLYDITLQTLSGYPTNHTRQVSVLKRLKKAQNDPNLPPRLRKDLEQQIEQAEAYYENYMSFENKENKKRIFTWAYRKMVDKAFGGIIDMRELLVKIDGAYQEDWRDFNLKK